jgi:hypothetical protein
LLGLILAVGNTWAVAARSTIPLELNATVAEKELRYEKHPGKDDVCLLRFETGRALHVDAALYAQLAVGNSIRKSAWASTLKADERAITLTWSSDFYGMVVAMPAVFCVLVGSAIAVCGRTPRERS